MPKRRGKSTDDIKAQYDRIYAMAQGEAFKGRNLSERLNRAHTKRNEYWTNIVKSKDGQSIKNDSVNRYTAKFIGYDNPNTTRLAKAAGGVG